MSQISWLQSSSTVILEPKKIKFVIASTFFTFVCHEMLQSDAMILVFWTLCSNQFFHSLLLLLLRGFLVPLHFLPLEWYHLHIWSCWYFSCSAHSPNPWSGKKTPRDNATCNRGIYYWLEPGPPALTKGVRTKRPRAPVLLGIYWVQLLVGTSGLVTQLQGNFCWPNPSWAFSFPLIASLFLARHMLIGWL